MPQPKPRFAFWKGLLTGAAIEVPMLASSVWVLAQIGLADPELGFMQMVRLTTVFAGFAAVLTAGGVGRLAAYAWVDGGRRRAIYVAARAHAVASAGLIVIATVPHGQFPESPWGWFGLACTGLLPGVACGAIIGFVCSGVSSVPLPDTVARPGGALRQLLDPKDLVRLGSALRTRTSTLFEGIFEPAPLPPDQEPGSEPAPVAAAAGAGSRPVASGARPAEAEEPRSGRGAAPGGARPAEVEGAARGRVEDS